MTHKDTIPVIFNGGSYGTYLEYVLNTWTDQGEQSNQHTLPFTEKNNAHGYIGHHLMDLAGWRKYVAQDTVCKFVRLHPKTQQQESQLDNVVEILNTVNHAVYIKVDADNVLNVLNNYYSKIWDNWEHTQFTQYIDINLIYNNWPVVHDTPLNEIPQWVMREFLSYYLIPAWQDQTTLPDIDHPGLIKITVHELLYNFDAVLHRIFTACELTSRTDLTDIHNTMLSNQKFLGQDHLCTQIIDSFVSNVEFDYSNNLLTLVDEVWLQWRLRDLGWELKCHGLNQFPRSTSKLQNCSFRL